MKSEAHSFNSSTKGITLNFKVIAGNSRKLREFSNYRKSQGNSEGFYFFNKFQGSFKI